MPPPLQTSRRLRTFFLMAFVHQLNACPCGCLEQNGWYQAAMSLVGSDVGALSDALVASPLTTTAGVEKDHCDGDTPLMFYSQRNSEQQHGAGIWWFAAHGEVSYSIAGNVAPDGALVNEHVTQPRALNVRARSQVLLI